MILVVSEPLEVELGVAELETFEAHPYKYSTTVSRPLATHTKKGNWFRGHIRREKSQISNESLMNSLMSLCEEPRSGRGSDGKTTRSRPPDGVVRTTGARVVQK